MASVTIGDVVMDRSWAYRLWQAPFAERKLEPVLAHNDLRLVRRVLDVGCGPGTNTHHFAHADYLGIDLNPGYVEAAARRTGRQFVVADVTSYTVTGERFDFVLINSFLHHIDDAASRRILEHLATLITDDGHIHILELVMPRELSAARLLAQWDRGDHARPLEAWRTLLSEHFEPVVFEPYPLGLVGLTLWNMVYFKGRPKSR